MLQTIFLPVGYLATHERYELDGPQQQGTIDFVARGKARTLAMVVLHHPVDGFPGQRITRIVGIRGALRGFQTGIPDMRVLKPRQPIAEKGTTQEKI